MAVHILAWPPFPPKAKGAVVRADGRPPKGATSRVRDNGMDTGGDTTAMRQLRRSVRLETDLSTKGRDNATCINFSNTSDKDYQSVIAKNLAMNNDCARLYCDGCFSVLSCVRSRKHLEISESVYIHVHRPVLCVQK